MAGVFQKRFFNFLLSARRHPVVLSALALIAAVLIAIGARPGRTFAVIAYLTAVVISAAIVDISVALFEKPRATLPVWFPKTETIVAAIFYSLAAATWAYRFSELFPPQRVVARLLFAAVVLLFGLQILLALFLLLRGYSFRELGIRFWGFAPVPLIMLVCMGLVALATPLRNTWREGYREVGGARGWIESGLLMAALPEEFFRMVWQTRLGKLLGNPAAGWLAASVLWAMLHWFIYAPGRSHSQTLFALLEILPYGLLLGYLTHRTQSILPAILLHATKFVWLGSLG